MNDIDHIIFIIVVKQFQGNPLTPGQEALLIAHGLDTLVADACEAININHVHILGCNVPSLWILTEYNKNEAWNNIIKHLGEGSE
jgi:hypothetical protein